MRALGLAPVTIALSLLAACGTSSPAQPAAPTRSVTATVTVTPTATPSGPGTATLLGVCDHVRDAFRDGTLPDRQQFAGLATELQGIIDVADRGAVRAVRPLQRAAQGVGLADSRAHVRRFNQEYRRLGTTCRAAGSTAWNG